METLRLALREAWELARARSGIDGQLRAYPLDEVGRGTLASISADGDLGVLVPIEGDKRPVIPRTLRRQAGIVLDADFAEYVNGSTRERMLGVWCREPALHDVFASFGESFLGRVAGGMDAVSAAESCVAEFRHLLTAPKTMQTSMLVGLLGELILLADITDVTPAAIDLWCADSGERHDFRHGACAVEVKTTLRSGSASQIVHISAVDQLEPPDKGDLYLHLVRLEEVVSGTISLESLVAGITSRVGVSRAAALRARLSHAGMPESECMTRTFALLERRTFHVRPQFPRLSPSRLVSSQLDPGIRAVEYDLDLSACQSYIVGDEVAVDALTAGVAG